MTEEKFTELINLYLDKEISSGELKLLKQEIDQDSERRKIFEDRVRLEKAMRLAFGCACEDDEVVLSPDRESDRAERAVVLRFPRWAIGSGLAASLLVGAILVPQAIQRSKDSASLVVQEVAESADAPLDRVGEAEFRRYAAAQDRRYHPHASLASHMRLLGLRPEHTPRQKKLQTVQFSDYQPVAEPRNQAELLREIQKLQTFPETKVLFDDTIQRHAGTSFGRGFNASLVKF